MLRDSSEGKDEENREVGTHVFDEYPTYEEWIAQFDMDNEIPDMGKIEAAHFGHLPVWVKGNAYFDGAKACKKEEHNLVDNNHEVTVDVEMTADGDWKLKTNLYDFLGDFRCDLVNTETLGRAFEPNQPYENTDGTPITFDRDYLGSHRDLHVIPGPFASAEDAQKKLW